MQQDMKNVIKMENKRQCSCYVKSIRLCVFKIQGLSKVLCIIKEVSRVAEYSISIQKAIAFLSNNLLEML